MPIDTRVSIENDRCRACLSAAWWNGHAAQMATGAASATRTHCQPGKRDHGKIDNTMDRSVSGTKNTRARISRRRRRLTVAPSAANEVSAASGRASSAESAGRLHDFDQLLRGNLGGGGDVCPFRGKIDSRR